MSARLKQIAFVLFGLLLLNSAYLAVFSTPSLFYMGSVLAHIAGGTLVIGLFAWAVYREQRWAAWVLAAATLVGLYLAWRGNTLDQRAVLWTHIALAVAGVLLLGRRFQLGAAGLAAIVLLAGFVDRQFPNASDRIRNPAFVPTSMEEEGAGPQSPFWPSSVKTNLDGGKGLIKSEFFMESERCGECHRDIYEQWKSSMHHFASFNNQFYRKSIEHMQEVQGSTKGSKWCAGCHDHAVLFSGKWEKPIHQQIDTPEAQTGLGCVSCHAITNVQGSMGQGGFTIEYPELHDLAASTNPWMRKLDYFLTYAEPEPHRRSFMKPFMRQDSAEYCAACHKVHLDVPVNNYRWLRGFNDYDNWQASGVSGQGARSFYYPEKSSTCSDCHMPLVASKDPGNRGGQVHSHRFAAANTAVAVANRDDQQLKETIRFLKSGWLSVDIFAVSPAAAPPRELPMQRRAGDAAPQLSSTMAVGEEGETSAPTYVREVGQVSAPVDVAATTVEPGSTVRVDVVVRTRKVGHFFPGGTVDSFDIWLELQGKDADGRIVFWSGKVEDDGKGPVDKGAHFYRSYMLDGAGNPINKRNAWQARSVLYVRLIPPGAADVAHYRVKIPADARGPITFTAKVNYRKFAHYYTQYSYAGVAKPDPTKVALDHDSREYSFAPVNIPKNVSGSLKDRIPDVPIVSVAEAQTTLALGKAGPFMPKIRPQDKLRWNDWGIGMLLQGDLKGAQYA
ncbi:MAG: cytochrome c family protein, partial [Bryobacteraceae bacterium]|nr:cytochrome c family protein [Bryobacteraceae bacterium]